MSRVFPLLVYQLISATKKAAIAAYTATGHGDKKKADGLATETMRIALRKIEGFELRAISCEGKRDNAPMFDTNEILSEGPIKISLVFDPLENTNATAKNQDGAVVLVAASEAGGLMPVPDEVYMKKIIVGHKVPKNGLRVDVDKSIEENVRIISKGLGKPIHELEIVVLERERNKPLIEELHRLGVHVTQVPDGDVIPAIKTCLVGASTHAVMGIGASPEGVITAAAVRLLHGQMSARFWPREYSKDPEILQSMNIDPNRRTPYTEKTLAPGKNLAFCTTSVTSAIEELLPKVSEFPGGARTHSMLVSNNPYVFEVSNTTHVLDDKEFRKRSEFRLH